MLPAQQFRSINLWFVLPFPVHKTQHAHAQLIKPFGLEADRHLLRSLFSHIDFADALNASKNSVHAKLLTIELNAQLNKSALLTNICFAVDKCFAQQKVSQ